MSCRTGQKSDVRFLSEDCFTHSPFTSREAVLEADQTFIRHNLRGSIFSKA